VVSRAVLISRTSPGASGKGNRILLVDVHRYATAAPKKTGRQRGSRTPRRHRRDEDKLILHDHVHDFLVLPGHSGRVWEVAFSSDDGRLATGGDDGTARIWDIVGDEGPLILPGHGGSVWDIAFSADDQWLAIASEDCNARIWDARTGKIIHTLTGHTGQVWGVTFNSADRYLATASGDGTARIWNCDTGECLLTLAVACSVRFPGAVTCWRWPPARIGLSSHCATSTDEFYATPVAQCRGGIGQSGCAVTNANGQVARSAIIPGTANVPPYLTDKNGVGALPLKDLAGVPVLGSYRRAGLFRPTSCRSAIWWRCGRSISGTFTTCVA
jgi:WD domain, G-beta repeat